MVWIIFIDRFRLGHIVTCLQNRSSRWIEILVLVLVQRRSGFHIMRKVLAVIYIGEELAVVEQSLLAEGIFLVARPLDARSTLQLLIGHARVIAGSSFRHFLPCLEGFRRVRPMDQR